MKLPLCIDTGCNFPGVISPKLVKEFNLESNFDNSVDMNITVANGHSGKYRAIYVPMLLASKPISIPLIVMDTPCGALIGQAGLKMIKFDDGTTMYDHYCGVAERAQCRLDAYAQDFSKN